MKMKIKRYIFTLFYLFIYLFKGSACGKYHRVAVLGISDAGDSDILTLFENK
jgi:ribosomal protein L30E